MKHIVKGNEPNSLQKYRTTTPNASYSGFPAASDVREALLKEQGFICAYCMNRISADLNAQNKPKTEIEHYRSQHRHPKLDLVFSNMLGVCNGNAGKAKHKLICDKAKSTFDQSNDLTIDPLRIERINQLHYTLEGEIFSLNEVIEDDLNRILNLNEEALKEERRTVYVQMKKKIKSLKDSVRGRNTKFRALLHKERSRWSTRDDNNRFNSFCGVRLYLIDKELNKF